jgi:hypothetical protein
MISTADNRWIVTNVTYSVYLLSAVKLSEYNLEIAYVSKVALSAVHFRICT